MIARAGETLRRYLESILAGSIVQRAEVEVAAAPVLGLIAVTIYWRIALGEGGGKEGAGA